MKTARKFLFFVLSLGSVYSCAYPTQHKELQYWPKATIRCKPLTQTTARCYYVEQLAVEPKD